MAVMQWQHYDLKAQLTENLFFQILSLEWWDLNHVFKENKNVCQLEIPF